ncbi:MAG: aminopeptidase P family protein [Actinobacteria bacterium]|nr:aminopeptidase P family protein [Actinomycetota bacterium]
MSGGAGSAGTGAGISRIERLAALLEVPLLVTSGVNVRYLTGLASSNAALLVDPGGEAILFTDFRYAKKARTLEGVRFEETARALIGDLATRLAGRTIGIEAHVLSVASLETLTGGGVDAKPTSGLVERLRAIKEAAELESLKQAAAISDDVFGALAEERFVGRTEFELAWRVRELFNEHGSSELSFDTMVAAADNGASPHSDNRDVKVPANTLVIVDAGCRVDGYASDCTRTFATGDLPDELARAYAVCLEAQLAGLEAMEPGASGRDADTAAREVIAAAGWGEEFGHGLGHGIGLEVHEAPTARPESTDSLEAGNVLSCEPGIYLPDLAGVRIEDMVLITDDGRERLTQAGKKLVTVS